MLGGKPIAILGAGPTGLGSAWRLNELGRQDWILFEANGHAGGLAASFVDSKGFTWDIGGHVQFSHYQYFDNVMNKCLGTDGWLHHQRESWVWIRDRFIPYPFQNNVHRLPPDDLYKCLEGLLEVNRTTAPKPRDFKEWIYATFGPGLAEVFMLPYNFKVWAYPPEMMSTKWVGERVAVTDIKRVLRNLAYKTDDISWGPNNTFQFPKKGGTGAIWRSCAALLPQERLNYEMPASRIDLNRHEITLSNGAVFSYGELVSTIPLPQLIRISGQNALDDVARRGLLFSASTIVGLGLRGKPPPELASKCWIYFPESNCPFYRVTVFSNYSPNNVPDADQYWSIMAEVSSSPYKSVDRTNIIQEVISGAIKTRLVESERQIASTWSYHAPYGYPTPGVHRDEALEIIVPYFEKHGVYPRGRFGMWKYEVSNQDHSFMQGVELVDFLLNGRQEITARDPVVANSKKHEWIE